MTPELVVELVQRTIEIAILLAAPILGASLVSGLIVSLFQAVTQINESTLTFLPKILAAGVALALFLPWMVTIIVGFATKIFTNLPMYVG